MCRYYGALVAVILLAKCEVMSFHIQLHPPTSKVSGLSRLYVQAPGKPKRRQQPFIETIKDNLFPTVGVNDDIEEKTEEDYQIELLQKVQCIISLSSWIYLLRLLPSYIHSLI